jgi:periplasmic divalent cation tolerance protein
MSGSSPVIVLTTLGTSADAGAFAERLVEERLAACVNVLPEMDSTYRWDGQVQKERERQVVIKTTTGRLDELKRRIAELHAYEVPELLVLPVIDGSVSYLSWVASMTERS